MPAMDRVEQTLRSYLDGLASWASKPRVEKNLAMFA